MGPRAVWSVTALGLGTTSRGDTMTYKPTPEEVEALAMLRRLEREWEKLSKQYKQEDMKAVKQKLYPKK
jgi:ABC-type protease/lipase transport system fused ATPase/permease subunit